MKPDKCDHSQTSDQHFDIRGWKKEKPYMYCLKCKRWCYSTEKIHCWICPVCRQILDYKPVVKWEEKDEIK